MTLYLPTDEEATEGIGAWNYTADVTSTTSTLAAFEQDAQDRYARLLRQHGNSGSALVNGSVGATRIPASCVTCRQAVTVNRGAM